MIAAFTLALRVYTGAAAVEAPPVDELMVEAFPDDAAHRWEPLRVTADAYGHEIVAWHPAVNGGGPGVVMVRTAGGHVQAGWTWEGRWVALFD